MTKKGFTLIELLVVIAIIAILAAILFPVFAKAREKARQATCVSNQKQIMNGFTMYAQDYDERYPSAPGLWGSGQPWIFWPHMIQPYTKSWDVLVCPDRAKTTNWNYQNALYPVAPSYSTVDVAMYDPGISMSQVTSPAQKFLLADSNHVAVDGLRGWLMNACGQWSCGANIGTTHAWTPTHSNGIVMSYFDGHVKWLEVNRVYADTQDSAILALNPTK